MVPAKMQALDGCERLAPETGVYLLALARRAMAEAMGLPDAVAPAPSRPADPRLDAPARAFVSWHLGDQLVGCIGTLAPWPSLEQTVLRYAVEAGLNDPRTPPVRPEELPRLRCEISVLTEPQALDAVGLQEIAGKIVAHRDGVILRAGTRRAVFLPVVWNTIPQVPEFLLALCRKAGIDPVVEGRMVVAEIFAAEILEDAG